MYKAPYVVGDFNQAAGVIVLNQTNYATSCLFYYPPTRTLFGAVNDIILPTQNSSIIEIKVETCTSYLSCEDCITKDPSYWYHQFFKLCNLCYQFLVCYNKLMFTKIRLQCCWVYCYFTVPIYFICCTISGNKRRG